MKFESTVLIQLNELQIDFTLKVN